MPPPAEGFAARFVVGPALRMQPDRRLVWLVREGYEHAFEEIVRRYVSPLTRYATAFVGSRGEDVTQDSFSKALLALRQTDAEIELRPWLFRIVRNTALNELRDRPPTPEVLAEAIADGDDPVEVFERREELADLMRRLRSLPESQRAAIIMRELEGLSHEEIAAALGLSGGGARQAIYRARRTLRNGLGLMLPLPLLKALLAGGAAGGAEVATASVAGASGAGAGAALKAATATVLVAGAVGTGVAVQETRQGGERATAQPERVAPQSVGAPISPAESSLTPPAAVNDDPGSRGEGRDDETERHEDRSDRGDDNSGPGSGDDREETADDRSGHRSGGHGERSGPSHGEEPGDDSDHSGSSSGPGPSSGPGSDHEEAEDLDDHSGSGGSGSGSASGEELDSSGSGSSGSSGGDEENPLDD